MINTSAKIFVHERLTQYLCANEKLIVHRCSVHGGGEQVCDRGNAIHPATISGVARAGLDIEHSLNVLNTHTDRVLGHDAEQLTQSQSRYTIVL